MDRMEYKVVLIDGDYAHLQRVDIEEDETKLVARALLPEMISENCRLSYENLQYEVIVY